MNKTKYIFHFSASKVCSTWYNDIAYYYSLTICYCFSNLASAKKGAYAYIETQLRLTYQLIFPVMKLHCFPLLYSLALSSNHSLITKIFVILLSIFHCVCENTTLFLLLKPIPIHAFGTTAFQADMFILWLCPCE